MGIRLTVFLVTLLAIVLVLPGTDRNTSIASPATKICVDPTVTTSHIGYIVSVYVNVSDVTNMWSWNFTLYYDRTLLYCKYAENFSATTWRSCTAVGPTIKQDYNATHGRVREYMSATSGSAFNGSMTIALIYFNVTSAIGSCPLDIRDSVIKNKSGSQISHDECDGTFQTGQYTQVAFRFLGVDSGDNGEFHGSQNLIQSLTSFLNWQNATWGKYNYTSHIHLLSNASEAQSLPYCVGWSTKANVISEVKNFLGVTGPGESSSLTVRIFCYNGHGGYYNPPATSDEIPIIQLENTPYGHLLMSDDQFNASMNSTADLLNSKCVVTIFDHCYSGGFLNQSRSGRVMLAACNCSEESYGWQGNGLGGEGGYWTDFIGNTNADFGNGTDFGPLGIIGGLFNSFDANSDGWRSAGELFDYANKTTVKYTTGEEQYEESVGIYNTKTQHPQESSGVVDEGVPVVMYNTYATQLQMLMPWGENYKIPTDFAYNAMPYREVTLSGPIHQWGMLGDSASRPSDAPSNGPSQGQLLWNRSSLSPIRGSAAISSQKIVVLGAENGTVCAFDVQTGDSIWTFDSCAPVDSSPALADGMVFFGTDSGTVYALDEGTGRARWSYQTVGDSIVSSPAVCNGTVFVCSEGGGGGGGGCVYALDELSGIQKWNYSTTGSIVGSPAASSDTVFVGDSGGWLYALNMLDGTPKPPYPVPIGPPEGDPSGSIVSTPAIADPLVYVTSTNGRVYGINKLSGTCVWHYATSGPITSSPAVDMDRNLVIVGSQDEYVYALNRLSGGAPVWKKYLGPVNGCSPAISGNGLVYVGTMTNSFYCLNETFNGVIVWSYPTSGQVYSSPALTDEHAIVSSNDGTLYCFGPEFPYHDIAVLSVDASPSSVTTGNNVTVEFSIENLGNRIETFNVIVAHDNASTIWTPPLYLNPVPFHTETLTLLPGQTVNLTCQWCTIGKAPGNYRIVVMAPIVYDVDPKSNLRISDPVQIITAAQNGSGRYIPYMD